MDVLLPLRNHGHEVSLIPQPGRAGMQLGRSLPDQRSSRQRVLDHWGWTASPRSGPLATIDLPLDRRTQTVLSHQLPTSVARRMARAADGGLPLRRGAGASNGDRLHLRPALFDRNG